MQIYEDIPRLYTALAEWGACLTYLLLIRKTVRSAPFWLISVAFLILQSLWLLSTGNLPTMFWIPSMAVAAVLMYAFLMYGSGLSPLAVGYCCAKAFLLAELAASLEWQLHSYLEAAGLLFASLRLLLLIAVYGICFSTAAFLEKPLFTEEYFRQLTAREMFSAAGITLVVFAFSNLSFIIANSPFTSRLRADIFNIRTLADLAGFAILHAYQSRICEYAAEKEISQMNAVLKSQYDQYRNYQDSVELIHMKYHDLKHQIAGLRAEFRRQAPGLERFCPQIGETIAAGTFEQELPELFRNQPKISIDYAVMEHARFIAVAESRFDWDDVGSWTSLRNHFATDADGNVADGLFAAVDSRNLVVSGSPDHLIAAIGVDNLVIVQTRDVTLVCAANQAQRIKELLKAVGLRPELRHFL